MSVDTQALINECITFEEAERDAADACDRHYWDGWDRELVRQGTPMIQVATQAPGLGKIITFTYLLCIALPDGTKAAVRDIVMEKVPAGRTRRNGREGYGTRRAAALYGKDIPVSFIHHV